MVREETATGEEGAVARCTGEFACPYQDDRASQAFRLPPRLRYRRAWATSRSNCSTSSEWVKEPADIFTLEERNKKIRLEEVEGFGETSVRNLFGAIEARRQISLERFIYALGIRHVGETTAVALARGYGTLGRHFMTPA